jgi:threonine synthase
MKSIKERGKYAIQKENLDKINVDFLSARMDENEILNTIKNVYEKFDKVLDPHSAIGYGAFDKVKLKGNNIVLATAHPSKFPDAIEKAINIKAELPDELTFILDEKENYDIIDNNLNKIKQHIKERIK